MPNPQLTSEQREALFVPLFSLVKQELDRLSAGDPKVLWALRRKLAKELIYLERGKPSHRKRLKDKKYIDQIAFCAICGEILPFKDIDLDRKEAYLGYTAENTRLVHRKCHREEQAKRKFA